MEVGIDLVEIDRIRQIQKKYPQFVDKVLGDQERLVYDPLKGQRQTEFLAGRFAAKEAYAKALGCGIGRLTLAEIQVLPGPTGKPYLASGPIIQEVSLSISHADHYATAVVYLDLDQKEIEERLTLYWQMKEME